jgi:hypothetical protein
MKKNKDDVARYTKGTIVGCVSFAVIIGMVVLVLLLKNQFLVERICSIAAITAMVPMTIGFAFA